jgi:DNA-binding NarL/FixJ family response regulator
LTREGPSSFRSAELEVLRLLHPAISVAARAFSGVPSTAAGARVRSPLTRREAEIVEYLVRGLQNAEIASYMGTSKYTVRNQVQHVFRKLDVSTRAELVAVVLANGWSRGFDEARDEMRGRRRSQ